MSTQKLIRNLLSKCDSLEQQVKRFEDKLTELERSES